MDEQQQDMAVDDATAERLKALDGEREIRSATFRPLDVADDGSWFEGYAAVFDEVAILDIAGVGEVSEEVRRGAFRRALSDDYSIPMLYHHLDTHPPLATTRGGTLQLEEDAKGLRVRADIARGYIGDAVRELVRRGDIPGMSWGFVAGPGNSKVERRGGTLHRTLTGFKRILDVSPTWDPSYRGTEAQFRSRTLGISSLDLLQQPDGGARPQTDEGAAESDSAAGEEKPETRSGGANAGADWQARYAARQRSIDIKTFEIEGGITL